MKWTELEGEIMRGLTSARSAVAMALMLCTLVGSGETQQIAGVTAHGWPSGRTSSWQPYLAVDGSTNTHTWTTASGTWKTPNHLGLDFGRLVAVNRIRLWKDPLDGYHNRADPKNLVIQFTTESGPITARRWSNVRNLSNGFLGTELMRASAVNPNGTVDLDIHDSVTLNHGWASLVFDTVHASGVRISFSRTSTPFNHYKVHEFEAYRSPLAMISGSGAPRPGGTILLDLEATRDVGSAYQVGTSLGTGPIVIGNRVLNLGPDDLLFVSVLGYWPWVFSNYRGVIDNKGHAGAAIHIPNIAALMGQKIHTAFVTLSPTAPSGIKSISNTFSFPITK